MKSIYEFRGVDKYRDYLSCDFCGTTLPAMALIPEEAGQWTCKPCLQIAIEKAKKEEQWLKEKYHSGPFN